MKVLGLSVCLVSGQHKEGSTYALRMWSDLHARYLRRESLPDAFFFREAIFIGVRKIT